ncbi:MAG: hypothetical protein WC101_00070 [Candidatus Gracilibacteria bacterium]
MRNSSSHFAALLKKTTSLLVGSSVGVAIFFGAYSGIPVLFAAPDTGSGGAVIDPGTGGSTPDPIAPQNDTDKKCSDAFLPYAQAEQQKFITFMNTHFKNAAPNSELLPVGLDGLKSFRNKMITKRNGFKPANTQVGQVDEMAYCDKLLEQQLSIASAVFEQYVSDTTYSKQSTALSAKLANINGKLRSFGTLLSQLDGYFTTFGNKLSSFTQSCIKK